MANTIKTVGTAMLTSLLIPVAGLSGLGAVGSLLSWLFIRGNLTSGVALFFVISLIIFILSLRFLIHLQKKAHALVEKINKELNLNLNKSNLLGYPSPIFFSFDKNNRKIAVCNIVNGSFTIHDLSYLLEWSVEWKNKNSMEISGVGRQVDGTNMHAPNFQNVQRRENFCLVIGVGDVKNPILKFPMSERAAVEWCARLNAIVNG